MGQWFNTIHSMKGKFCCWLFSSFLLLSSQWVLLHLKVFIASIERFFSDWAVQVHEIYIYICVLIHTVHKDSPMEWPFFFLFFFFFFFFFGGGGGCGRGQYSIRWITKRLLNVGFIVFQLLWHFEDILAVVLRGNLLNLKMIWGINT